MFRLQHATVALDTLCTDCPASDQLIKTSVASIRKVQNKVVKFVCCIVHTCVIA